MQTWCFYHIEIRKLSQLVHLFLASLYILRGRILLAEAEYRLATHTLETACFRSPGRGEAYGLLGLALLRCAQCRTHTDLGTPRPLQPRLEKL